MIRTPHSDSPRLVVARALAALLALLAPVALLATASCRSADTYFFGPEKTEDPAAVPGVLDQAEAEAAAGDLKYALNLALGTRAALGQTPEMRDRVERTVERIAALRIDQLAEEGTNPKALEKMLDYDLPRQLAVSAGISAARLWYAKGKYDRAFRRIRDLDTQYPAHHERIAAGEILTDVGFTLLEARPTFFGLFGGPKRAIPSLEYLVLRYPSAPRCDDAYAELARLYLEDRDYRTARQRYEDLLLYHPESELSIYAEAQVPRLRMISLKSPEYDRRELVLALGELERWLERHPGHELEPEVRLDLADCLLRLAESDFAIARFYVEIEEEPGAVLHGERALEFARRARDDRLVGRLERFLEGLPPATGVPLPLDGPAAPGVNPIEPAEPDAAGAAR